MIEIAIALLLGACSVGMVMTMLADHQHRKERRRMDAELSRALASFERSHEAILQQQRSIAENQAKLLDVLRKATSGKVVR